MIRAACRGAMTCLLVIVALASTEASGQSFGWNPVPEASAALAAATDRLYAGQVRELEAMSDDRDALLYRYLAHVLGVPKLVSVDQGPAGTCVGASTCQALGVGLGVEIEHKREPESWQAPYAIEAIYAMGRQMAGQLGNWDGSCGAWSCAAIREWGTVVQGDYRTADDADRDDELDLRQYDPRRAQQWASRGVPAAIKRIAHDYPVRAITRVSSTDQAKALLQNGYPLITCSRESYVAQRDAAGFARNDGRNAWPHAMAVIAYRGAGSGRAGFLILNSWGDWCEGPTWPEDQPIGSFWVTPDALAEHVRAGDTWAIGDIVGFQFRRLRLLDAIDSGGPGGINLSVTTDPQGASPRVKRDTGRTGQLAPVRFNGGVFNETLFRDCLLRPGDLWVRRHDQAQPGARTGPSGPELGIAP